ncbi:hypothetical protein BCR42DRAFT_430017, partial [Absidia repens]
NMSIITEKKKNRLCTRESLPFYIHYGFVNISNAVVLYILNGLPVQSSFVFVFR